MVKVQGKLAIRLLSALSASAVLFFARQAPASAENTSPVSAGSPNKNSRTFDPKELHLDMSEDSLAKLSDFAYFAAGHFGDKTQYMGRYPDEFGGAYAVHCRQGKPFCIEVKYMGDGVERESAMQVMQRLLPKNAGAITEHDDDDLKLMDAPQAAEFFYYKTGPRTELLFARGSNKKVVQISIWTKEG